MNQFAFGASIPFVIAAVVYAARRGRAGLTTLLLTPCAMLAFGLWAVLPDIPRLTGHLSLYHNLAHDPRTDLFLWHYSIDRIETESPWPAVAIVVMAMALFAVALRELQRAEAGQPTDERAEGG